MNFEKVRHIIAEQLNADEDSITMDTDLVKDLDADSLDVVELVMEIEQNFNVDIPDELLTEVKTIRDIVDFLDKNSK